MPVSGERKRVEGECAAILDVCRSLQLIEEQQYIEIRQLLGIVSMLIKMAQNSNKSGTGTHTHPITHKSFFLV